MRELTGGLTTLIAIFLAAIILALALVFHPFGPTYSFMPFGTNGTGALRLNGHSGVIDVCSITQEAGDPPGKRRMTCGPTWPR